jgi:hypothetical protein
MRPTHALLGSLLLALALAACTPTLEAACTADADCGAGRCVDGLCLAPAPAAASCTNKLKDGDETAIDCGGKTCGRCAVDAACALPGDCASGLCASGKCAALPSCQNGGRDPGEEGLDCGAACGKPCPPVPCGSDAECPNTRCDTTAGACAAASCSDGLKNGGETDADCGGPCEKCADGRGCNGAAECRSGVCKAGACASPACDDRVKNGDESDEDCGGACAAKCEDGKACANGPDCRSGYCSNLVCAPAACGDGARNGDETDEDCGGSCAAKCADAKRCLADADCLSRRCDTQATRTCLAPACNDGRLNGGESAMDCGGTTACPRCLPGLDCLVNEDCASGVCDPQKKCAAPSCNPRDFVVNGLETDLDCGGAEPACPRCELGKRCLRDTDCVTNHCSGNVCAALRCNDATNPCTDPLQVCDAATGRCSYQPCPSGFDDVCTRTGYCNRVTLACEPNPCSRPGCGAAAATCTTAANCCSGRCGGPFVDALLVESSEPVQPPDAPSRSACPFGGIRISIDYGAESLPPRFACDDGDPATPPPTVEISPVPADTTCVGGGQRLRITDNVQGVVTTDELFCHRGACADRPRSPAPGGLRHFARELMVACPGNYGYAARASACGTGFHVCTATEWTIRSGGDGSPYNAWVDEPLSVALFPTNQPPPFSNRAECSAIGAGALTSGTPVSCAADRPARVCTVDTTADVVGNSCGPYTTCGLGGNTANQFFGGCDGTQTASVLCCRD